MSFYATKTLIINEDGTKMSGGTIRLWAIYSAKPFTGVRQRITKS